MDSDDLRFWVKSPELLQLTATSVRTAKKGADSVGAKEVYASSGPLGKLRLLAYFNGTRWIDSSEDELGVLPTEGIWRGKACTIEERVSATTVKIFIHSLALRKTVTLSQVILHGKQATDLRFR